MDSMKAHNGINTVVDIIRMSNDKNAARNNLMGYFGAAAPAMSLVIGDVTQAEFECGMAGVKKISLYNKTMEEMVYFRDVMEMPDPVDYMGHTEGIPDACKPLIRSISVKEPHHAQMIYGIPDAGENEGRIRKIDWHAYSSEAEGWAMTRFELLFGPVGKELMDKIADAVIDGIEYREKFFQDLVDAYEK
jgi:hypothetical protein